MTIRKTGVTKPVGSSGRRRFDNRRAESTDAPQLSFYRNRYYDQATGRWLTEDQIGIAGGVNLYQYVGNNPVAYTDPFGLSPDTVKVGCRALKGILGAVGNHRAVRVDTDDGESQVGELLKGEDGNNNVVVWDGQSSSSANYSWTTVAVPQGMTSAQFDQAVIGSFNQRTQEQHGKKYTSHSQGNSNRFVFDVITKAGGKVPQSAVPKTGLTPGLCGGGGRFAANARRAGAQALWLTALGAAVILVAVGIFDWSRLTVKETPLHTYLLLAVIPTLATALVVQALASRHAPLPLQITVGMVVWLGVGSVTLLTGFYS